MSGNNPNQQHALELKAGIFVLIGLVFIAVMAFKFGRLGQGLFQQYYPLTVTFPTADGLIKNSDVQLAGARIGYVAEKPVITPGGSGVTIPLEILDGVKIPRESSFVVGSSGLLGDKFVDIAPKADFNPTTFNVSDPKQVLAPGETIAGSPAGGLLGALQGPKGEAVLDELTTEIQKLTDVTQKIDTGILSTENQQNITDSLASLKATGEHFDTASKDLDTVLVNAKGAVDSAKVTLGTLNATADDVRTAIIEAQKTIESARTLLTTAQTGNGLIPTLLNDREVSDNLKALVVNLREHGVLFYKNKADGSAASATPGPPARVQRQF
jgi:phospholipid/cholesterol/gamma-HCH transport system substrate-binding protein